MKLFGELFDIDYAVLPIGDNYTMGPDDALIAAKFLKAKCVIPVHYSTWPVIEQNPADFKEEAQKQGIAVKIVRPGKPGAVIFDKEDCVCRMPPSFIISGES